MKATLAVLLAGFVFLAGCDLLGGLSGGRGAGTGSRSSDPGPGSGNEAEPGQTVPTSGTVGARIRNLSDRHADVTLNFLLRDTQVHLSFMRVPPQTSTTVIGPEQADTIDASAVDADGQALPERSFVFGVDFDEGTEAVYVIEGDEPLDNVPPTLTIVQPAQDVRVPQGGILQAVIDDEDPDSSASIDLYLDPNDVPLDGNEILLGADFPEDPDGPADTFGFSIGPNVDAGFYRLIAVIEDEVFTEIVQSSAVIEVFVPSVDSSGGLSLALLTPAADTAIAVGGNFNVTWTDQAPNDNANIELYLDPNSTDLDGDEFLLASGINEDPDGAADGTTVSVAGAPTGTYRVLGRMVSTDGTVFAQAPGFVTVAIPPSLTIDQPAQNVSVFVGQPLSIAWSDEDDDSNAQITLFLDANTTDLDGDEIQLATFDEDPDGTGQDQASVILNVEPGTYDVLGVITDGLFTRTARSAGQVLVVPFLGGGGTEPFTDCQPNGIPDDQELIENDCNSNGVPDECDPDCDGNEQPDACQALEVDCNSNNIPDVCELADNDCNSNGMPDECDLVKHHCYPAGLPDDCPLVDNDCNTNDIPDDCELAGNDCNSNGVPDECDLVQVDGDDGDGVLPVCDVCPNSDLAAFITISTCSTGVPNLIGQDGCTMNDLLSQCFQTAPTHGEFVQCVVKLALEWARTNLITATQKDQITACTVRPDVLQKFEDKGNATPDQ